MLLTIAYFIIALLLLVIVHEYGHFIVARWCGVKVLRFSFGFGKVLARCHDKRGTEYVWSLFPLGGYVKMLDEEEGEVPAHEKPLAFNNQSIGARVAIVVAGPFFNFLFAFFSLWLVCVIGVYSLAPMIASVKPGAPAAQAGLHANEEILSINEKSITSWRDFQYAIMRYIGSKDSLTLVVKSLETNQQRSVTLPLSAWHLDAKNPDPLVSLGIVPFIPTVVPIVGEVLDDSPAKLAGIEMNDKILRMNDKPCNDWLDLVDYVRQHPGKELSLVLLRKGQEKTISIVIGQQKKGNKLEGYLGLRSQKVDWPPQWLRFQHFGPVTAISKAFNQTVELTGATFALIGRFITGQLALKNISGPVGIAQGAGDSGRSGLAAYLSFLAIISISLGVLNLLPIPMLDGGHLLFYLIEFIKGKPVSELSKNIGLYAGLLFLIALTILAFSNDLSRLWY